MEKGERMEEDKRDVRLKDEGAERQGPPRGAWRAAPYAGDHAASVT
jgi:hypothetical protein